MVALGPVCEVGAREPLRFERVRVRGTAGDDVGGLVAAGPQRLLGQRHLRRLGTGAVALEHPLHRHVEVALMGVRGVLEVIDHLGRDGLGAPGVEATRLCLDRAAIGDDVDRGAARDRADVRGRLGVEPAQAHRRDRGRRGGDRAAAVLGADPGVHGAPMQLGEHAVVGG